MNFKTLLSGSWIKPAISREIAQHVRLRNYRKKFPKAIISPSCRLDGNIQLGRGVSVRENVCISGNVSVGKATFFNGPAEIRAGSARIEIGSFCSCAGGLTIICSDHPMSKPSTYYTKLGDYGELFIDNTPSSKPVILGSDIWIGKNCTILKGVRIGSGAVLAAGAVVTSNVEPYAIVGGVPGRKISDRFPPHVKDWLLSLEWWKWSDDKLAKHRDFLATNLSNLDFQDLENIRSRIESL